MDMEQSFVKLKIAEKEERLRKEKEKKNNMKSANSTNQKDGKYYLVRLEMEVDKLNILIDSCEKDSRLSQIPEEASGKIRNAIGKAQLLIRKRFQQFRELCRDNIENDPDKKETKPSDLQGYWDMMYIQIEDVDSLFKDIDQLRANNWLLAETDVMDGRLKPQDELKKTNGSATSKAKSKSPTGKSPRSKTKSTVDDEKVKREARSRLAAARKQAKLRAQEAANAESSLNGSWTVETTNDEANHSPSTTTNANDVVLSASFNTECSLNSSSNSSSAELLSNDTDIIDIAPPVSGIASSIAPAIEVNGVA